MSQMRSITRQAIDNLAIRELVEAKPHSQFSESEIKVALRIAPGQAPLISFEIVVG